MKYNPIKKILILVTILAVPGFLYYLLQEKGKNRYKPLAIYGPKQVAKTFHSVRGKQIPDTIYHLLPDFKLVDHRSQTKTLESYKGKVLLINLFYTQADALGVTAAQKAMGVFVKTYQKNPMMHFVSVTIDPQQDSVPVLANYTKSTLPGQNKWDLLTGDTSEVNSLVKKGLLLDAIKTVDGGKTKITFNNLFVLIDSKHRIRGYYEAANPEALSKLDDEIKVLVAEELRNMRDGR